MSLFTLYQQEISVVNAVLSMAFLQRSQHKATFKSHLGCRTCFLILIISTIHAYSTLAEQEVQAQLFNIRRVHKYPLGR